MKRFTRTISMIVTMSLVNLFVVIPALALPPIPSSFYGTVKVDGVNVADGIVVQALINGQVYAQSVTQTYQGNSVYALDVPGDDTDTPAVDGGHDGDIIQFKIGGNLASQTGIWKSGINISLNLTRTNASMPTPTPITPTQHPFLKSQILTPALCTAQFGTTNGSSSSLSLLDQSGAEDNPDAYISFQTPTTLYVGYQSFLLPEDAQTKLISTILVQVNFKGPASSTQVWTWSVYDWSTGLWIKIGDSIGTDPDEWQTLIFRIRQPWKYVSTGREIRIQLRSNNANGDAKIDYEALHATYLSNPATPIPATPVITPKRPGIYSAPTSTPRP